MTTEMNLKVTNSVNFYSGNNPRELVEKFSSPLYVYNENIFRTKCREMKNLCSYPNFHVNYAIKANTNLTLLSIAKEEGLFADISSVGEIYAATSAGFMPNEMLFIVNNVTLAELKHAIDLDITVSVDSLSQLESYGKINEGGKVCLRFNPGIGGGHHPKVITGGDDTKFGIMPEYIIEVKKLLARYNLKLVGINHHIGSQNWGDLYLEGAKGLLNVAREFEDLEFIDFGGGFAIPYNKQNDEKPLDLKMLGSSLDKIMYDYVKEVGKEIKFFIEPGRYISAECGVLLGTVTTTKTCGAANYNGTDMGFSVFARPTLYDSHHDIEIYRIENKEIDFSNIKITNIVGNQCESGDYIAKERKMPELIEGDILGILDAGAYGYSMSSNYNHRPRPAEILIRHDGSIKLIRKRDTFKDMISNMLSI